MFDDSSRESEYHFFYVPITEKLAESLSECRSYKRSYKYPFFKVTWQPYFSGRYNLKIEPLQNGYCRISAQNRHYKKEYDIPADLAKYVGKLMMKYCLDHKDFAGLKQFVSCLSRTNQSYHDSSDEDYYYIKEALEDIEYYISKLDAKNVAKVQEEHKQKLSYEEKNCKVSLSNMQNRLKSKFSTISHYYKKAAFSECEFTLDGNGKILSYNFTVLSGIQIPKEYRLDKCW
ncbi:MAG: hypothetical protein J6N49_06865 [Alphaproteobacteria bacterium]|nr:hypothetical protein [Alphaproteobacteria bacterium]